MSLSCWDYALRRCYVTIGPGFRSKGRRSTCARTMRRLPRFAPKSDKYPTYNSYCSWYTGLLHSSFGTSRSYRGPQPFRNWSMNTRIPLLERTRFSSTTLVAPRLTYSKSPLKAFCPKPEIREEFCLKKVEKSTSTRMHVCTVLFGHSHGWPICRASCCRRPRPRLFR